MALISWLPKLDWLAARLPLVQIGGELGITGRAVGYWTTRQRSATLAHQSSLHRLYERVQYAEMRASGLAPLSAAKYRGLSPASYDMWDTKLDNLVSRMTADRTTAYLQRQGIDPMDLSDEELDELQDRYREGVLDAIDEFGQDVEDAERYF